MNDDTRAMRKIRNQHRPRGYQLISDPLTNKGSAFTEAERRLLGLEGLLPPRYNTQDQQAARVMRKLAARHDNLGKYQELMALQDRNEYLFYRVLIDELERLMPIVYTPTVGEATQKFSDVFQRGRGIWITPDHRGRIAEILEATTGARPIELLVVTDNESILGIGDQGAGGMAISIGKLALYTACAGIAPEATLPVCLDVGTNNESYLNDPNYLGWPHRRIRGPAYDELVEEFVAAVQRLFPKALIQWEDFRKDNALRLLERYRERVLSFNDDIQGTGAVTLAGIYSALQIKQEKLEDQRIVIHGAGAAGLGISRQIRAALLAAGVPETELWSRVALLDSRGLLVGDRQYEDDYKNELAWPLAGAEKFQLDGDDRQLANVVRSYRPTVLIGTSGQAGAFDETIIRQMADNAAHPIILPLSNPTSNCEALPEDVLRWTNGRALIATGSPFQPVELEDRTYHVGQGNNVFIFPGLGLAALLAQTLQVTDAMITRTAQALADQVTAEEHALGLLYPNTNRLRQVTAAVAAEVMDQAFADGDARIQRPDNLPDFVAAAMWVPDYPPLL